MRRLLLASLALIVFACNNVDDSTRLFELNGQILTVKPETREILVKHEDIKGFMPAMTMPYTVVDGGELTGLAAGDLVTATLVVETSRAYLRSIKKTGSAPIPEGSATAIPAAAGIELLKPGDTVPATTLTDENGKPIAVSNFAGSVAAITFIYTRCPLPQYCPLMDRRFAEAQDLIAKDPALRGNVRLLSVSFDPKFDRAAVLQRHAQTLKADPRVWSFATADEPVVDRFAARFGVNVIREQDGTITHNLRTAVLDRAGRVTTILHDNAWTAEDLAGELKAALAR